MRRKSLKIGLLLLLSMLMLLSNPSMMVLAQEISQSPTSTISPTTNDQLPTTTLAPSPTTDNRSLTSELSPSPTPSVFQTTPTPTTENRELTTELSTTPTVPPVSPTVTPIPTLFLGQNQPESAQLRKKLDLLDLEKAHYQARERVRVKLLNDYGRPLDIAVRNTEGIELPVVVQRETAGDDSTLSISPYGYSRFRPGKYRLKITDESGITQSQDFTWGVLAINTNQSVYTPGDKAVIAMAVLDDSGAMVCDAFTQLDIIAPNGEKTTLGTWDRSIKVTDDCHMRALTNTADYLAKYDIKEQTGIYEMVLTAETKNGKRTVTDSFQVKESVPFKVERDSVTRIFPILTYDVKLTVTANEDFTGKIIETVPENFVVTPLSQGTLLPYDEVSSKSAILANATVAGLYKTPLSLPFQGDFIRTQGFSEIPENPLLQKRYRSFGLSSHDGVDFAMPVGTTLRALDEGKVLVAGWGDYGITVVLQHRWGKSFYGHLSLTDLFEGQYVTAGQEIGLSGNTGLSTGPHLHFSLEPKNPDLDNGFKGKIDPFTFIHATGESNQTLLSYQELTWNISMQKGQTVSLGYSFVAPDVSPQFYMLGPLIVKEASQSTSTTADSNLQPATSTIFSESRRWQIAAQKQQASTIPPLNQLLKHGRRLSGANVKQTLTF